MRAGMGAFGTVLVTSALRSIRIEHKLIEIKLDTKQMGVEFPPQLPWEWWPMRCSSQNRACKTKASFIH